MAGQKNHFLLQLQAQAEAKADIKARAHVEMDLIALLFFLHEKFKVGPGRADSCVNDFLAWKVEIAEAIDKEWAEDQSKKKEIMVVKRDLAKRLKEILGAEGWAKSKTLFPLLRPYWED